MQLQPHRVRLEATLVTARYITSDGSHDLAHFERVWSTARRISAGLGCDQTILAASCWLHDCVFRRERQPAPRGGLPNRDDLSALLRPDFSVAAAAPLALLAWE
jgi:hypothetical protein